MNRYQLIFSVFILVVLITVSFWLGYDTRPNSGLAQLPPPRFLEPGPIPTPPTPTSTPSAPPATIETPVKPVSVPSPVTVTPTLPAPLTRIIDRVAETIRATVTTVLDFVQSILGFKKEIKIATPPAVAEGSGQIFTKDNGIIRINLNEFGYPMITSLYILGTEVIPHDNAGADLQMNSRALQDSEAYNPTLGGDCTGAASNLTGYIPNWTGGGLAIDPSLGILLGVDPRKYNETSAGCQGRGEILPYDFNFGVTLGDGVSLPKQMMVLDMSIRREPEGRTLSKRLTEIPVAFPKTSFARYAYSSRDGQAFKKVGFCIGFFYGPNGWECGDHNHDVTSWPYGQILESEGKVVMLCNIPDALQRSNEGICLAFYSHFDTRLEVSRRAGSRGDLTLMNLTGYVGRADDPNWLISDTRWHTLRRILAVGNVNTVRAVISITNQRITDWGNWRR